MFIMMDSRNCVEECPADYSHRWSTTSDLMGRVCYPNNMVNSIHTVLVGIVCGALLCFLIVFVGVIVFRKKHQKIHTKSIKDQLINDEYERHEFCRQLDELRPHAEYFLHMLNDTRKQIRKLHFSGDTSATSKYYPIVRDLAKILILINRPIELIDGPPHDWNRLYRWADKISAQYKPQQIAQLIEFLQNSPTPSSRFEDVDSRLANKNTTTFCSLFYSTPVVQTRKMFSSTLPPNVTLTTSAATKEIPSSAASDTSDDMKHLSLPHEKTIPTGSLISLHDFEDVRSSSKSISYSKKNNPYGDSFPQVKNYLSIGSLRIVDDEFIQLGLRPGDEITTEL